MQEKAEAAYARNSIHSLASPTESLLHQVIRFGIVGAIATSGDLFLLWFLTTVMSLWYITAAAFGYLLGLTICYTLSVLWIFPYRRITNRRLEFTIFVAIGIIALALTEIILYTGVEFFGLSVMTAKLIAVFIVFFFNFGARKLILFTRPKISKT